MNETVLLAIIAVAGTAIGAAVSPVVELATKALTARTDDRSTRIKTVAEFSVALRLLASRTADKWDSVQIRTAYESAVYHRFEVAKTIPKGDGRVDWFCEYAVDRVHAFGGVGRRTAVADHASSELLAWARGDRKASKLSAFDVDSDGDGGYIVI